MTSAYRNVNVRSLTHHLRGPERKEIMKIIPVPVQVPWRAIYPPRFPGLPVALLRILIDDPTSEVAHLM